MASLERPELLEMHRHVLKNGKEKDRPEHAGLREQFETDRKSFMRQMIHLEGEYRVRNDKFRAEKKAEAKARQQAEGKGEPEKAVVELDEGSERVLTRIEAFFKAMEGRTG